MGERGRVALAGATESEHVVAAVPAVARQAALGNHHVELAIAQGDHLGSDLDLVAPRPPTLADVFALYAEIGILDGFSGIGYFGGAA